MDELEQFLGGISLAESGSLQGDYTARNQSGAYGRYQIMPQYWDEWSAEAGIPGASINDPAAQDRVARFKLNEYHRRFGSWDLAAVAWRAGPSVAQRIRDEGWGAASSAQVSSEQLRSYLQTVMGQMGSGYPAWQGPVGQPGDVAAPFTPGRMVAQTLDAMSQLVAGGQRVPVSGINTRALAVTSPESVDPMMAAIAGIPAVSAEGTETMPYGEPGASWSSGRSATHTHATNAARLADPQYQQVATNLVTPAAAFVEDRFGLQVGQYRDLDVRPAGGAALSDHYWGGALDIMTADVAKGNEVAAFFRDNAEQLGVNYVLWQTDHHYDHVHVSFLPPGSEGAVTDFAAAMLSVQGVGIPAVPENVMPSTGPDREPEAVGTGPGMGVM